ncbi:MAG: indolepyruvate ferredoxin oxidoreductase subunit alpha [Candidatus Helarchaeota archaeon]
MLKIELEKISQRAPGDPGDFIKINPEKCVGCGKCVVICVANLWKIRGGIASIKDEYKEKCFECGGCYSVCDAGAIDFSYPAGGTGVIYLNG